MKRIGFLVLLLLPFSLWARPAGYQARLAAQLETKVQQVAQASAQPQDSSLAQALAPFSVQERQAIMSVINELHSAKQSIRTQFKFPADRQDRNTAGLILGRLLPVVVKYDQLWHHNKQAARVAGFVIAQEEITSKDGKTFEVPAYIEQYVDLLRHPSFPPDSKFPLVETFTSFREHILQDKTARQ